MACFDEDSITMAVEAAIDCLDGIDRSAVDGVYFSSVSLPYKERLNSGIISAALGLGDDVRAADFTGGLKSGTTAVLAGLETVESKRVRNLLVCSSDCRMGKAGSPQEMIFGDAGAAFLLGSTGVVAEFKGSYSLTLDFVDHYRGAYSKFDRQWEERWIKDMGYNVFIPQVIEGLVGKYGIKINDFKKVIYPCCYASERKKINRLIGISDEMAESPLQSKVGESGSAQSLLMLANALDDAKPGDRLLVVSFGSGCDALYFEITSEIDSRKGKGESISSRLRDIIELDNYEKYLVWKGILPADQGLRAEEDLWTRWSVVWRKRKAIYGLYGSKCKACGVVQFPPQSVCVNSDCGAINRMEDFAFADKIGRVTSFTVDRLAASLDPPAVYGMIEFDVGGKCMLDITDCDIDSLAVGMPVRMSFRRKYYDENRDISGYFWKAVPRKQEY